MRVEVEPAASSGRSDPATGDNQMSFVHRIWARQLSQPAGLLGKLMGRGMAVDNRLLIEWTLEVLEIQPTDSVLEIGFGPGVSIRKAVDLASRGWVAGIELSATMVEEAKRLNAPAIAAGRAELRQGNADALPYPDDRFDRAFAVNVHYFWKDPLTALREIRRVMRPGGRIALGFIDKEGLEKQKFARTGLLTLYNGEDTTRLLAEAGFSEARCEAKPVHRVGMGICAVAQK
jgi:SAM-dependent methyltransferase